MEVSYVASRLLTQPMWIEVLVLIVCARVCVYVCHHLSSTRNPFKAKVGYQQKALNVGNKNIELKIFILKVMTVIS